MAKIISEYDTKTKSLSVSKDGSSMANVHYISMGRKYDYNEDKESDEYDCHLTMVEKADEEGYHTHTHIVANELGDLVEQKKENITSNVGLSKFIQHRLSQRRARNK